MALIIEDGSNVANANSFATVAECRAYAEARGLDLPVDDTDVEPLLVKAADYINSLEEKFQGYRYFYDVGQALSFPRENIYIHGRYVGGEIPEELKNAQCQFAVDANENDLLAPGTGREVIEKKIGPLTTKWNPTGNSAPQFESTAGLALLEPFFTPGAGGFNILNYQ